MRLLLFLIAAALVPAAAFAKTTCSPKPLVKLSISADHLVVASMQHAGGATMQHHQAIAPEPVDDDAPAPHVVRALRIRLPSMLHRPPSSPTRAATLRGVGKPPDVGKAA